MQKVEYSWRQEYLMEDEIDVSRGEMLVHPDNLPTVDRNFDAMMVWMDEEPMDVNKSFFIKQTSNLSRTRIDTIKYKVTDCGGKA